MEIPMRRPDGELRWMRLQSRPHRTKDSAVIWDGVQTDITERKRAEEALRESEDRFRGIFKHAATGISITDLEYRFQSRNPAYTAMLGYTEEELRAASFPDLVHPEDRELNLNALRRLVAQEIPWFEVVNRYVAKDGKPIWVNKHVSLLRDAGGAPTRLIALVTDISERKRQEEQVGLLMREVNHRAKNMLALVQAIARQTAAIDPEDFVERFGDRDQRPRRKSGLACEGGVEGRGPSRSSSGPSSRISAISSAPGLNPGGLRFLSRRPPLRP